MANYKDDPEYQTYERDHRMPKRWSMVGQMVAAIGLGFGGAFLVEKTPIIGVPLMLSSLIPTFCFFRNLIELVKKEREFEVQYKAKQTAKGVEREIQQEINSPQQENVKNWQQEVAPKDIPQVAERGI